LRVKIYHGIEQLPPDFGPVVATIGNFDGVHRGHRMVIAEVIARAHTLGIASLAITFDPHPVFVLHPAATLKLITPLQHKLELLADTGIDATLILPFTTVLSHMSARDFASEVLVGAAKVVEVHEGENFRFGHNAEAGVDGLEALGRELGFTVKSYAPRALRGAPVSSSRIRALIAAGDMNHARALLGRPFAVDSTPASGRGFGTKYAVPTINLAPYPHLLPANGVYCTTLTVAGEPFRAVTNIGNRPTFGADSFAVESYLLNFHPLDLQPDTPLCLTFYKRLRGEKKWPTPEALKTQIALDVKRAERFFTLAGIA
jgi:riboflavin kinase/FMN adenylyltransferase